MANFSKNNIKKKILEAIQKLKVLRDKLKVFNIEEPQVF